MDNALRRMVLIPPLRSLTLDPGPHAGALAFFTNVAHTLLEVTFDAEGDVVDPWNRGDQLVNALGNQFNRHTREAHNITAAACEARH